MIICKRVQELESESCVRQKEQESLLAVIFKSLKEEHQAELQNLQRQMAQVQENQSWQLKAFICTHSVMRFCRKADMSSSVVTGQTDGGAAA